MKYLITFILILFFTHSLFPQDFEESQLYVYVTDDEAIPQFVYKDGSTQAIVDDLNLKNVLNNYEVYDFERYLSCVDSITLPDKYDLDRVYKLSFGGNAENLKTELEQSFNHYYDLVERVPVLHLAYTPNDYHFLDETLGPNWALDVINAKQAWDITQGDTIVIIGITDLGFNLNHEDLVNKVKLTYGGSEIVGGHGTATAGAAAGDTDNSTGMSSIGFNSRLAVGFMDYERICQMAVDDVKIINTSWAGNTISTTHRNLLNLVRDMGTLVVSAAGNGTEQYPDNPTGYRFPAAHESTLAVTSIGPNLNHLHIKPNEDTMYHTHHDMIDICAPGYGIIVPWDGSSNANYIIGWGSSYASPVVAGLAGLLLSLDPDLSPAELKAVIQATAQPVSDAHLFPNDHLGAGVIDAYAAVDFIANCAPTIISVNTSWEEDQTFFCDIIVEEGAVLEVFSNLKFGQKARIIVKRGGHLILDGAKLSFIEKDRGLWPGIEVWGTYAESQFPSGNPHQGKITMRNGATIENARTAILAGKSIASHYTDKGNGLPFIPNYQYNGGIVVIHQASFVNNKVSIYWPPYENHHPIDQSIMDNAGFVHNSDFIYNAPLNTEIDSEVFIMLNGVRGIGIKGNHFYGNEQTGILSLNAGFTVKASCLNEFLPCQNYRLSTFNNLRYGVRALGSASGKTFGVDTAVFNNTITGVYTSQVDHFSITRSQFNALPLSLHDHLGGIYVDGNAFGFQIEENHFTGNYTPSPFGGGLNIGITFNQTGPFANELYNNTFEQLNIATLSMNQNRDPLGSVGLCIKCNTYVGNEYDIVADYDEQQYAWGGIATHQGSPAAAPDAPAGNRFSWANNPNTPFSDIHNQGGPIYYYYHANASPALKLKPNYYNEDKVTIEEGDPDAIWDPELSCPSNLTPPGGGHNEEELRGMMAEAEQEADSTQSLIGILKDAGDTESLHWDVNMSAPWQGMEVYSELMSVGPYVSDTVLAAAIEKENVLVDAMIRDVLVANPHSAKSEDLMEKLDQRLQPLPDYMLDEVLQGQSLVSVYENLQANLSQQKQKQAVYQKQLVQLYLNDTLQPVSSADSLANLLLASDHSALWYRAAFMRHEQGDSLASANILNSIPTSFDFSDEQLQSHTHLLALLEEDELLQNQWKSISVPDSTSVEWLFEMMETAGLPASIYARNILLAHGLVEHQPQYLLPGETKSEPVNRPHSQSPPKKEALKLAPNPANEYVIIAFNVDKKREDEGSGIIKVSAINGSLIETLPLTKQMDQMVFPLKGYKQGTYLFSLYYNNQLLESKQLIIH